MERHKKILEYSLSSLSRRKYKNLSIIVVYTLMVAFMASILFMTHSFKEEALSVFTNAPDLIVQKVTGGRHDLIPVDYIQFIEKIPGVKSATPRYWGYYYDATTDGTYTIIGLTENREELKLVRGAMPASGGECAIGRGIMEARMAYIGGEILFFDSKREVLTLSIAGIFEAESDLLTNDLIVMRKEDSLRLLGIPDNKATDLAVEVYNETEVNTIARKITFNLHGTRPITKNEILRTYDSLFNWRAGMIFAVFIGPLAAFCILVWDKATGLSAEERKEIGILKAIGWDSSDILEQKLYEGAAISLTSFLTGIILAYIHIYFFDASFLAPALKGWSVLFPSYRLMPQINLYHIFSMFFLIVVPYTAVTIIPSWKVSVTDPDVVMR